jgi:hypothetical protein
MSEMQSIHKAPRNLTLLLVKDPTTVERERNARKKNIAQIGEITIVALKELNRKIDTLTQGTTLAMTIATLPEIIPSTITIIPLPDNDNIPKSVIVIAMIEMLLTSGTLDAIPHTIIMAKIVHHLLMLTPSKEILL